MLPSTFYLKINKWKPTYPLNNWMVTNLRIYKAINKHENLHCNKQITNNQLPFGMQPKNAGTIWMWLNTKQCFGVDILKIYF